MKKTNKRVPTNGFDNTTIDDRLTNLSRFKTERDWKKKTSEDSFDSKVDTLLV